MRSGLSSVSSDIEVNPPFSGVELGFWRQATACRKTTPNRPPPAGWVSFRVVLWVTFLVA